MRKEHRTEIKLGAGETMQTMTLDEAQTHLAQLVEAAAAGEEIFITNQGVSVQLVPRAMQKRARQFGSARGLISLSPDFDAPLNDFIEYSQ